MPRRCNICGYPGKKHCDACMRVREIALAAEPESLVLVVDGSVDNHGNISGPRRAGAGLVLARAEDEVVIAMCAAAFYAKNNCQAEREAVARGLAWAPVERAWTDYEALVSEELPCMWIPPDLRDPLHSLAHRLANAARLRDWSRLDRVWVPGEVW